MTVSYLHGQKTRYRITLDIEALSDFNPSQINWDKVLELQDNECVESYIEDLSNPISW